MPEKAFGFTAIVPLAILVVLCAVHKMRILSYAILMKVTFLIMSAQLDQLLIVPTSLIDEHNYYSWNERTFNDELTLVWTKSSLENTQGKNAEPNNELQIRDGSAMFGSLLPAESPKSVLC